jgi:hypothetical protein
MPQTRTWIILFLLLATFISQAQDENATQGWDIIERCVSEATEPPDDWTYDGTILATGWAGIHGINAAWETPSVLHFETTPTRGDYYGVSSSIAPNGLWYAELYVSVLTPGYMGRPNHRAEEIIVSSLVNSYQTYRIELPWIPSYDWATYRTLPPLLYWWDDNHLLFQRTLINPFTSEITEMETLWYLWRDELSPDRTRMVHIQALDELMSESNSYLWIFDEGSIDFDFTFGFSEVDWANNSRFFVAVARPERERLDEENRYIVLVDADGNLKEDYVFEVAGYAGIEVFPATIVDGISSSNRYFLIHAPGPEGRVLYIADTHTAIIYRTCIGYQNVVWSPYTEQVALIPSGEGQRPVQIFDLEDWQVYIVAYHDGRIIGWREDPE